MDTIESVEFGPMRGIGIAITAKGGVTDFGAIWMKQLMPRKAEIAKPLQGTAFAICRCLPGSTDGTFEYVAMMEATADAAVPAGMIAVDLPRCDYLKLPVSNYAELSTVWQSIPSVLESHPEWKPFCSKDQCQCASHPSFEHYPWDPEHTGNAFVYVPVSKR